MRILLIILIAGFSSPIFGQKWTQSIDKFTKVVTYETDVHKIRVKKKNLLEDGFIALRLAKIKDEVLGELTFNTSFNYEYLASKSTLITFLYENDSTTTSKVLYGKSTLMSGLGLVSPFYSSTIFFPAKHLTSPITAIRIQLEEYKKDYDLKEDEIASLLYFVNTAVGLLP